MQFSMLFVVLMGMGVTFAGLTCIILLTMLLGRVVAGLEKAPSDAPAAAAPVPAPAPADASVPDEIKAAIDMIRSNVFSILEPGLFDPIIRSLLDYNDYYMLLADLRSYSEAQDRVDAAYRDAKKWNRMSLVNVARSGFFSSDRSVMEYARDIWHISPVKF